jgi:predicted amino acid racemase
MGWCPRLEINLEVIQSNVSVLLARCQEWQVRPVFVTKGFLADFPLVKLLYDAGVRHFADSNLLNLLRIRALFGPTVHLSLIRLPMRGEFEAIQEDDIVPFVSHWETLKELDTIAARKKTVQKVMLAVESGDAREGFLPEELLTIGEGLRELSWISIQGIGSTLACLSGILPSGATVEQLVSLKRELSKKLGGREIALSVGGTTFLELWESCKGLEGVDEVRFGEAFLFGSDISRKKNIDWLKQGAFTFFIEVVEVRSKEVDRFSSRGFDAFGSAVTASLEGKRKRALLAVGKQDVDEKQLYFLDTGVKIVGATSNYLVVDIEESEKEYRVGDVMCCRAGYGAVLRAFLSPYVEKVYLKGEGGKGERKL